MFQASLCPSSGALDRILLQMVFVLDVLAGVLGSQEAGRVHCVHTACFPTSQDTSQHIKYKNHLQ